MTETQRAEVERLIETIQSAKRVRNEAWAKTEAAQAALDEATAVSVKAFEALRLAERALSHWAMDGPA